MSQPVHVASAFCSDEPIGSRAEDAVRRQDHRHGRLQADPVIPAFPSGRSIDLASGLMEITYDTGAKVILQGPVTYEVEANGGYLAVGKLTGRLEKNDKRGTLNAELSDRRSSFSVHRSAFVVRTPTATVTDLGTEFGIEVSEEGITEARVFVGQVQVAIGNVPGNAGNPTQVISAGQYAQVGRNEAISVGKGSSADGVKRFTRVMPTPPRSLTGDEYAKLVLSMNPAVYYRMEQWPKHSKKGCYVLVDSAPGGHHGVAHPDQAFRLRCEGRFGDALDLHGPSVGDHAIVPDYPKTDNGQLSVSAWVWASTVSPWRPIVQNWWEPSFDRKNIDSGQFFFGLAGQCDIMMIVRDRDGTEVRGQEGDGHPLPCGKWQHVAFVATGVETVHLYRNGVEVCSRICRGIAPERIRKALGIGCRLDKSGASLDAEYPAFWDGRIDELAIFNRALARSKYGCCIRGRIPTRHRTKGGP